MSRLPLPDTPAPDATSDTPPPRSSARIAVFVALCLASVVVAAGYAILAARRADRQADRAAAVPAADAATLAGLRAGPHLLFLDSDGDVYRRVAVAPFDAPDASRALTELQCQRVYFTAGEGLCLGRDPYKGGAAIFDADFQVRATLPASGLASRARISPDGRYGSTTVFVQGHSYADSGFSTQTTLIDMAGGTVLADLEDFTVFRDGERFRSVDFNFWGVTFGNDSNRFYATLGSGGKTYLVEGDIARKEARVLRENVECPSLSPDNTRLVFKKQVQGGSGRKVVWQLYMLDLATMTEHSLAETRNIDDQVEWLDGHTILYTHPDEGPPATIRPDLWRLNLDDGSAPERLATRSFSPAAVR
jgi:hypothetical protein